MSKSIFLGIIGFLISFWSFGSTALMNEMIPEEKQIVLSVEGKSKIQINKKEGETLKAKLQNFLQIGDTITTESRGASIELPENITLRLEEKTKITLEQYIKDTKTFVVRLHEGEIWANTSLSSATLALYTRGAIILPQESAVNIKFNKKKTTVQAEKNPVQIALTLPGNEVEGVLKKEKQLNNLLVTEGSQTEIPVSKLKQKINKLLQSKLIKEFKLIPITEVDQKRAWIQENIQRDKQKRELHRDENIKTIKKRGTVFAKVSGSFYEFRSNYLDAQFKLTFNQEKKREVWVNFLMDLFDDGVYFTLTANQKEAKLRFTKFREFIEESRVSGREKIQKMLIDKLKKRLQKLLVLEPEDGVLFEAKKTTRDILMELMQKNKAPFREHFYLNRTYLFDVNKAAGKNIFQVQELFDAYFTHLKEILRTNSYEVAKHQDFLAEENQLLASLFLENAFFYKDTFFSKKTDIEEQWLALLRAGNQRNEEKQTLILSKITLMKRLRQFFFQEKLSIDDARDTLFRLMTEIEDAIPESENAVSDIFRKEIEKQQDFWLYLNSSEFANSQLYGQTHEERYNSFLLAKEELSSVEKIKEGFIHKGENQTQKSKTIQEIQIEVQETLEKAGIKNVKIGLLLTQDQKIVPIEKATFNNIEFSAVFNRDINLLSQIEVEGKIVFYGSIKPSKIETLLAAEETESQKDIESEEREQEEVKTESTTEKVAKLLVSRQLEEKGILANSSQIIIVSLNKKEFRVFGAKILTQNKQIISNFTIKNGDKISKIEVQAGKDFVEVQGEISLDGLVQAVEQFYDKTFYENLDKELKEAKGKVE